MTIYRKGDEQFLLNEVHDQVIQEAKDLDSLSHAEKMKNFRESGYRGASQVYEYSKQGIPARELTESDVGPVSGASLARIKKYR